MSTKESQRNWTKPDDLIRLQRLKQRKNKLAARLSQNNHTKEILNITENDKAKLLEAKLAQKRKNPFAKSTADNAKKAKTVYEQEDSLFDFVNTPPADTLPPPPTSCSTKDVFIRETPTRPPPAKLVLQPFDTKSFSKLLHQNSSRETALFPGEEDDAALLESQKFSKHLPMDWSIKTRVRFFCRSELPATMLKTSQIASGLTSFVRCIDTQNLCSGLDISPATRLNQATYYWQHPYLPWMTLFPRNSKDNIGITLGERERKTLVDDWDHSFGGLFQLLRARQCPYFYLCANTFTVLFRAAGIAGHVEMHALMTPTSRGMRSALRQEGIEYTMPLKKDGNLNRSSDAGYSEESNSVDAEAGNSKSMTVQHEDLVNATEDDADEHEDDDWLESLGVDEKEIRRINTAHTRKIKAQEMADDFSDNSLILIEGVELQGFYSFLLNAKSTISSVGRLAGVPPTLLAPVAFPKATMQQLITRSSKVRMDGIDYCTIELKGIIMPTLLPYICQLLGEAKDTFSATLATSNVTLAFSKATKKLLEQPKPVDSVDDVQKTGDEAAEQVFEQENLSDCGILPCIIEDICRTGQDAVNLLENVCYDKENGYAWS